MIADTAVEPLKLVLQRWGYYQATRYLPYPRRNDEAPTPDEHPLARAKEFAPGTRERAAKLLLGRDGRSRRQAVGAAIGMAIVPKWSSDPIPCKEGKGGGRGGFSSIDRGPLPEYQWIDDALIRLRRKMPVHEIVVRTEFTVNASQLVKARIAAEEYGGHLSKSQYRRCLALGLSYLEALRT